MEILLWVARVILAIVFGVAGIAKLMDREGARRALTGFGVSAVLAAPLAWALPIVEILVAVALLPLATAWLGGIGALILLTIFLLGISVNLIKGNAPDCHCFGQLHSEPVSWSVFARNLLLALIAALIAVRGKDNAGLSAVGWLSELRAGEAVSLCLSAVAVALLLLAFVLLRKVLKQQTALLETVSALKKTIDEDYAEIASVERPMERQDALPPVEGLPVGAVAPSFTLPTLTGQQVSLADLRARGNAVLLLFVSPGCSPCKTLLPHVRAWQRDYAEHLTIVLLSNGTAKEAQAKLARYEVAPLLLQGESSIADEYQAKWTPAAVLIDRRGRIASPVTSGDEAIRALVTHAIATSESPALAQHGMPRPQIKLGRSLFQVGESAPRFALPDLQNREVDLNNLLGQETLLLFWNPDCGYCQTMADDLIRWEAKHHSRATRLVFISSGADAVVRKESERFHSLFLHDAAFEIAPMFGAKGTPSAVLLDADGRITSSLAVGEQNILALLGIRKIALPIAKGLAIGTPSPSLETVAESVTV